jgi:hypothetical protein
MYYLLIHPYLHSLKHSSILKYYIVHSHAYTYLFHRLYISTMCVLWKNGLKGVYCSFSNSFLFYDDLLSLSY